MTWVRFWMIYCVELTKYIYSFKMSLYKQFSCKKINGVIQIIKKRKPNDTMSVEDKNRIGSEKEFGTCPQLRRQLVVERIF